MFGYTQKIENAAVSRRGLKCVWLPVREMNRERLVAIWIHAAIQAFESHFVRRTGQEK